MRSPFVRLRELLGDLFLAVGTSLAVYPIAHTVRVAMGSGAREPST